MNESKARGVLDHRALSSTRAGPRGFCPRGLPGDWRFSEPPFPGDFRPGTPGILRVEIVNFLRFLVKNEREIKFSCENDDKEASCVKKTAIIP